MSSCCAGPGVPLVGFTWYSLTDQVDWDIALARPLGKVDPVGLFDLNRDPRAVGLAYKHLIDMHRDQPEYRECEALEGAARLMAGFLSAHGYDPGPTQRPLLAGAISGVLATLPAVAILLYAFGALAVEARILGLSELMTVAVGCVVMAVAGAIYARLFGRAANDARGGWLFGMVFGFALVGRRRGAWCCHSPAAARPGWPGGDRRVPLAWSRGARRWAWSIRSSTARCTSGWKRRPNAMGPHIGTSRPRRSTYRELQASTGWRSRSDRGLEVLDQVEPLPREQVAIAALRPKWP